MVFDAVKDQRPAQPRRRPDPEPEENGGDDGETPRHNHSGGKKALLIIAIVLAVLCVAAAGAGFALRSTDAIYPNVTVGGVSVGGMTEEQAATALGKSGWDNKTGENVTVVLPADVEITVNAGKAGAVTSSEAAARAAYRYGRDGGLFSSLFKYVRGLFGRVNLTAAAEDLNADYIRGQISDGVAEMKDALSGKAYKVDTDKAVLTVVKGATDVTVDENAVYDLVVAALQSGSFGKVDYQSSYGEDAKLDIQALHDEVYAEVKDAAYDSDKGKVTESVVGVDFDVAEAQKLWDAAAAGDTVSIPLEITQPKITTDDLSAKLFKDKLGAQVSYFKSSSANRINNITLAAKKINGTILNPGEEFSYNDTVGQRTEAAGFKKAGAYSNGEVVQELGGGICQVSSTLYCTVLYANLEITDRTCHYFPVDYLPAGLDATVSWKSPDFKFKNDRNYPVKIVATVDSTKKSMTIEIWGTDVDGSYVEMKYSTWKFYDTKYPTVALGYKATTYRNVFNKDGTQLSSTKEATSTYHYHAENIVYPSASPSPTPTPAATPTPQATPEPTVPVAATEPTMPVAATETPADSSSGVIGG
ncbi:MAG TPA: VanW family protein [Oscillospiraceae bacterium]|nr:VanW family protein [Oscillospiraceae bacterium]